MKSKREITNKPASTLALVLSIFILLTILFSLSSMVYADLMNKYIFEESVGKTAQLNATPIFSLDKILVFSSAHATQNEVNHKAIWDVNVSQFSDIAIYLNNHGSNPLTYENTITSLYLDNIQYNQMPEAGTPTLLYKNVNQFGKYEFSEANIISNSLKYEIVAQDIHYETPQLYLDGSSPICFSFVNKDIKVNHLISDTSTALTYNGSLLKRCNISLTSIATTLSFDIHIINALNQHFKCNVNLEIPLKDDNTSIYDGSYLKEWNNLAMYSFYRIK